MFTKLVSLHFSFTDPYNGVKFTSGDLLSSLHCGCHLLLVLLREKRNHLGTDGIETLGNLSLQGRKRRRRGEGGRVRVGGGEREGGERGRGGEGKGRRKEREREKIIFKS